MLSNWPQVAEAEVKSRVFYPEYARHVPVQATSEAGPPEIHSPIEFSRFHIAEAVWLWAGQQQNVSLSGTKDTCHTGSPEWEAHPRGWGGYSWGEWENGKLLTYRNEIVLLQANDVSNLDVFPLDDFEPKNQREQQLGLLSMRPKNDHSSWGSKILENSLQITGKCLLQALPFNDVIRVTLPCLRGTGKGTLLCSFHPTQHKEEPTRGHFNLVRTVGTSVFVLTACCGSLVCLFVFSAHHLFSASTRTGMHDSP